MGIAFKFEDSTTKHHFRINMKAFVAAVACLAILPALSSAAAAGSGNSLTNLLKGTLNKMAARERDDEDSPYPPTGNPLAAFIYCTGMESDDSSPFALPQCIFTSVAYGQCCTGLPCYESNGNEGICEMMYNFGNQILENFLITMLAAGEVK